MQWKHLFQSGMLSRDLVREKPIIGVYGRFQIGKSTLLNCLLEDYVALTGKGLSTTALTTRFRYRDTFELKYRALDGRLAPTTIEEISHENFVGRVLMDSGFHIEAKMPSELLKLCDIVDTPGFDANESDTAVAMSSLEEIHYIIFVLANRGLQQQEKELLLELFRRNVPVLLVMNCVEGRAMDRWIPQSEQNLAVMDSIEAWLTSAGCKVEQIGGRMVYPCNFLFYWYMQEAFEKSVPYIDRPQSIQRHVLSSLECQDIPYSRESVLEISGVEGLIRFLKNRIGNYNPVTHEWRNNG